MSRKSSPFTQIAIEKWYVGHVQWDNGQTCALVEILSHYCREFRTCLQNLPSRTSQMAREFHVAPLQPHVNELFHASELFQRSPSTSSH